MPRSSAPPSGSPGSSRTARPSRSANGRRSASAAPVNLRWLRSASRRPTAGSDVSQLRTRAVYDEASDTLDPQRYEDLDHERRHRRCPCGPWRAWAPELGAKGQACFVVPPRPPGSRWGRSSRRWESGRRTPPSRAARRDAARHCLLGGRRSSTSACEGKAGGSRPGQAAMATFEASRPPWPAQARRDPPGGLLSTPSSNARTAHFRAGIVQHPGDRISARRHEGPGSTPPGCSTSGRLDGHERKAYTATEGSMSKLYAARRPSGVTDQASRSSVATGTSAEYPVERLAPGRQIYTTSEGTSEIPRLITPGQSLGCDIR